MDPGLVGLMCPDEGAGLLGAQIELGGLRQRLWGVCAEWEGFWVGVEVVAPSQMCRVRAFPTKETEYPAGQLGDVTEAHSAVSTPSVWLCYSCVIG